MGHALGLSSGSSSAQTRPPQPTALQPATPPAPSLGHAAGPRLFLLIHALELWGRGLELGTKFRHGGAGRQPGIHTRCTRNVQAECLASESPEEAAQPPCPYLPPHQPVVGCPFPQGPKSLPLLTFSQTPERLLSLLPGLGPPNSIGRIPWEQDSGADR